jgi:hypothetical protein
MILKRSTSNLQPFQSLGKRVQGPFFRAKANGARIFHSPPASKNEWNYTATHSVRLCRVHKDNLTSYARILKC